MGFTGERIQVPRPPCGWNVAGSLNALTDWKTCLASAPDETRLQNLHTGSGKGDLWLHAGPHPSDVSWTVPEFFLGELFELEIKVNFPIDCTP